jgi:hypothetical protein
MSEKEVEDFFNSLKSNADANEVNSMKVLKNLHENLIETYREIEINETKIYENQLSEVRTLILNWDSKTCKKCNASLIRVNGPRGPFWPCPNFRSESGHSKYDSHNTTPEYFKSRLNNCKVRIKLSWLTDIKNSMGLPKSIKSSHILKYLLLSGYEDLRIKYGSQSTYNTIGGFQKGKRQSSEEEKHLLKLLCEYFPTVKYQLGIRYKFEDSEVKFCFIDLIASDKQNVNIIEVKRDPFLIRIEQLELYKTLIKHVMNLSLDNRNINAVFVVFNDYDIANYFDFKVNYLSFSALKVENQTKANLNNTFHQSDFQKKNGI